MKYDRAILVDNINILIKDNNITQSDLAKIIGTHQGRLSECLNKKKDFTLPQVVAIADYFKVSLDDLLNRPSRAISSPDTLSELCEYFFALTEFINFDISYQDVPTLKFPCDLYNKLAYNESEYKELERFGGDFSSDNNKLKGIRYDTQYSEYHSVLSLALLNDSIISFLDEWKSAMLLLNLSNGKELYETWKKGVLTKYENHLKIYQYKTEEQYIDDLIEKKYTHCITSMKFDGYELRDCFAATDDLTLKAEWKKHSDEFNKSCSDIDRKLLEPFDDLFNNWCMLAIIPNSSSLKLDFF